MEKFLVDCENRIGKLSPIWRSFGYDEINWTYTPRGKRIFKEIGKLSKASYYIRCHHTFTSGNGLSTPTKGSTNVCPGIANDGSLKLDFTLLDQVIDTFLQNNCKPLVELGFMPDVLSRKYAPKPTYDYSGTDRWAYPPKDYRQWQELIYRTVQHYAEKYGPEEVSRWYWELWNEPDNPGFFKGKVKNYCRMYDYAVAGANAALDSVKIGGPGLASNPKFLDNFLNHCAKGKNAATGERGVRLDFISFHAKGTDWPLRGAPFKMPSLSKIFSYLRSYVAVLEKYPQYRELDWLFDECDMAVATNYGVYDFPEFIINNNECYPVFVARLAKYLLDFIEQKNLPIKFFTTWAFYFEGKRFFEGNRALFTNENIKKPVFNAFVLLEKLGEVRLGVKTESGATHSDFDKFPQVDALASCRGNGEVSVMIWNFHEDLQKTGNKQIHLEVTNLQAPQNRVRVRRFQIDSKHSNAHSVWQELGSPQAPSPEQIQEIKQQENLESVGATKEIQIVDGKVTLDFELPMHSVCLVEVSEV